MSEELNDAEGLNSPDEEEWTEERLAKMRPDDWTEEDELMHQDMLRRSDERMHEYLRKHFSGPTRLFYQDEATGESVPGPWLPSLHNVTERLREQYPHLAPGNGTGFASLVAHPIRLVISSYAVHGKEAKDKGLPSDVGEDGKPPKGIEDRVKVAFVTWEEDWSADKGGEGFMRGDEMVLRVVPRLQEKLADPAWRQSAYPEPIPDQGVADNFRPDATFYCVGVTLSTTPETFDPTDPPETISHTAVVAYLLAGDVPWLQILGNSPGSPGGPSFEAPQEPRKVDSFPLHTGQEMTALFRAAAHAPTFSFYRTDPQAGEIVFKHPQDYHSVRFPLWPEERLADYSVEDLKALITRQDPDFIFAANYIVTALLPSEPLAEGLYAGGWIDLYDVARKIGKQWRTTKEGEEIVAQVWDYIRFGARSNVHGSRSGTYKNPKTKEVIPTKVSNPLWSTQGRETPEPTLFPDLFTPVRVELILSREWLSLFTSPYTKQFVEMLDHVAAIPGGKAAGAWARSIGLAYLNFCRLQPYIALTPPEPHLWQTERDLRPSREYLLSQFPARVSPYRSVLDSTNPGFALKYWVGALDKLVKAGIFAPLGEAKPMPKGAYPPDIAKLPRQGFGEEFQEWKPDLRPGEILRSMLHAQIEGREVKRQLPARRGKGRPKKLPS